MHLAMVFFLRVKQADELLFGVLSIVTELAHHPSSFADLAKNTTNARASAQTPLRFMTFSSLSRP